MNEQLLQIEIPKEYDLKLPDPCLVDYYTNKKNRLVTIDFDIDNSLMREIGELIMEYNRQDKGRASKIVGIRNPESESKEVGFLQGSFEDKTSLFFAPLEDSLHGGKYELDDMKRYGKLSVEIPYYLKGRTFTDSILVCDEAEDFSESEIKLIGTRLGENSKVYWCGDYKQSVMNKSTSNPLAKMCSKLKGNPKFACVCLGEDVRSSVSKIYSEIFDD